MSDLVINDLSGHEIKLLDEVVVVSPSPVRSDNRYDSEKGTVWNFSTNQVGDPMVLVKMEFGGRVWLHPDVLMVVYKSTRWMRDQI